MHSLADTRISCSQNLTTLIPRTDNFASFVMSFCLCSCRFFYVDPHISYYQPRVPEYDYTLSVVDSSTWTVVFGLRCDITGGT